MIYDSRRVRKIISMATDEDDLKKMGYACGSTLGEGSYAKVKSAFSDLLNCKVAIKIINRKRAPKDFQNKFLPRELDVLRMLDHPNVTHLYDILTSTSKVFIVMELAGHGDLLEYIKLRGAIPEEKARKLFTELVNGVDYLHGINVTHRDLKCENILLDVNNHIKISDFGFARVLPANEYSKTFCGSAAYAAPEILQGIPYTGGAYDIWSMGVILYIMVCGSMPYDDSNIKRMIRYQTERRVGFTSRRRVSQACKDLIYHILESDIGNRATISDIRKSYWMSGSPSTGPSPLLPLISPATLPSPSKSPAPKPTPTPVPNPAGGNTTEVNKEDSSTTPETISGQGDQPPQAATPPPVPETAKTKQQADEPSSSGTSENEPMKP